MAPLVDAVETLRTAGTLDARRTFEQLTERSWFLAHVATLFCVSPRCFDEDDDLEDWSYDPRSFERPEAWPVGGIDRLRGDLQTIADHLLGTRLTRRIARERGVDPCDLERIAVRVADSSNPKRVHCDGPRTIVFSTGALRGVLAAVATWSASTVGDALQDGPLDLMEAQREGAALTASPRYSVKPDQVPPEVVALFARGCTLDTPCFKEAMLEPGPVQDYGERLDEAMDAHVEWIGRLSGLAFVDAEYLKALTFLVAHEAAHVWFDGCRRPSLESEVEADAFAAIASFSLFGERVDLGAVEVGGTATSDASPEAEVPAIVDWLVPEPRPALDDVDELLDPYTRLPISWEGLGMYARVLAAIGYEADRALYPSLDERMARNRAQVRRILTELLGDDWQAAWPDEARRLR